MSLGEFMNLGEFYAELPPCSRSFLLAARLVLMDAIGSGDTVLFKRVLADVRSFPARCDMPLAKLGTELMEVWLRQYLHVADGYPAWLLEGAWAWLIEGAWTEVPQKWRLGVACLMAKVCFVRRDYVQSLAMAKTELFLASENGLSPMEKLDLKLVVALSLQSLGRTEESALWLRGAVEIAVKERVLLPLLELPLGPRSLLCQLLSLSSPELLHNAKVRAPSYFLNLLHFRNLLMTSS